MQIKLNCFSYCWGVYVRVWVRVHVQIKIRLLYSFPSRCIYPPLIKRLSAQFLTLIVISFELGVHCVSLYNDGGSVKCELLNISSLWGGWDWSVTGRDGSPLLSAVLIPVVLKTEVGRTGLNCCVFGSPLWLYTASPAPVTPETEYGFREVIGLTRLDQPLSR